MRVKVESEPGAGVWIMVPFDGGDTDKVEICCGDPGLRQYVPAYLGYNKEGKRVAKVRPPQYPFKTVRLRINGVVAGEGTLRTR